MRPASSSFSHFCFVLHQHPMRVRRKMRLMVVTVGPLSLLPPDPIITRSLIRRRILSSAIQEEGVACVGWVGFRCGQGV